MRADKFTLNLRKLCREHEGKQLSRPTIAKATGVSARQIRLIEQQAFYKLLKTLKKPRYRSMLLEILSPKNKALNN